MISCNSILFLFILCTSLVDDVNSKEFRFRPSDTKSNAKNVSHWGKKLFRKGINRLKVVKMGKEWWKKLPRIPKLKPKRIIKEIDTSKHNPCLVVKDICMNGGICRSSGDEWFCDCPLTHYGKSCQFLADQTHCQGNMCQNNATCFSIKSPRTVHNWNVAAVKNCTEQMRKSSEFHLQCNITISVNYKCWCRFGFEGDFCEFSEGMRCCAEDHCNNHGLIHQLMDKQQVDHWGKGAEEELECDQFNCTCHCEDNYSGERCEIISPCRDRECFNKGICKISADHESAECDCPSSFFIDGITVNGTDCDLIEIDDSSVHNSSCIPCTENAGGFAAYFDCVQDKFEEKFPNHTGRIRIADFFAQDCIVNSEHLECSEALGGGFCLEQDGIRPKCSVTVGNIKDFGVLPFDAFFLVPKCECPNDYEGDFCENIVMDECDTKDLDEQRAYVAERGGGIGVSEKLATKLADEKFLRSIRNRYFSYKPGSPQNYERTTAAKALERTFRSLGMRTFCGEHGLCRPYDEDTGMECKCDANYRGARCELMDLCSPNPCPDKHTLCVDFPIEDGDQQGNERTFSCICQTNQMVDPKSHQCMQNHTEEYAKCFDTRGMARCKNGANCYPCALDQKLLAMAGLLTTPDKGTNRNNDSTTAIPGAIASSLALCNEVERGNGFRCICAPGFAPPFCVSESSPCDFHHCQNGATCVPDQMEPTDYNCLCLPGYNGTLCQMVTDLCLFGASLCKNGGRCVLDSSWQRGFRCDCTSAYFGYNCELAEDRGWLNWFNDNYNWTYPLFTFSALLPVLLIFSLFKQRFLARRKYQSITRNESGIQLENAEEEEGEDDDHKNPVASTSSKPPPISSSKGPKPNV